MSWRDRPTRDDVRDARPDEPGYAYRPRERSDVRADPWSDREGWPQTGSGRSATARDRRPTERGIVTPTRVILAIAVLGSIAFLAYAVTVRDTRQIPLLASGAAVLGLVFATLAAAGGVATFRAGRDGQVGRALAMAIGGGVAGMIAAGAFAFALVIVLAYGIQG
jgi:hypothetical protein